MSHNVTIDSGLVTDLQSAIKAAERMNLEHKVFQNVQSVRLYSSNTAEGNMTVRLQGWKHPLVINTHTGKVVYDNYNGEWGKTDKLDEYYAEYMAQAAISVMAKNGFTANRVTIDGQSHIDFTIKERSEQKLEATLL